MDFIATWHDRGRRSSVGVITYRTQNKLTSMKVYRQWGKMDKMFDRKFEPRTG